MASEQITNSITSVSRGAEEQSASIDSVNREIQELSSRLNHLSEANQQVEDLSGKMNIATDRGQLKIEAEESSNSAGKIKELIKEIKEEILTASERMETGSNEVVKGEGVVRSASAAFADIKDTIGQLIIGIHQATGVVHESGNNSKIIVENIDNISSISESNSASAEEVVAVSQQQTSSVQEISIQADDLNLMAEELEDLISQFVVH